MKRVYITIFLVSCSVLMFEVSLTRLFSITLWYHFAFMMISIAMLGIGSAGTLLALFPKSKFISESGAGRYSALAGASFLTCYIASSHIPFDPAEFSWDRMQIFYLSLYCLVLSIPFFFAGLLLSTVFLLYSEKARTIYSADLLGAGTGSLSVLAILHFAGPEYAIVSASMLCSIGAVIICEKKWKLLPITFLIISLAALVLHPDLINMKMSSYKRLSLYLKFPGAEHLNTYYSPHSRIDTFRSTAVRFAPGLSLKYLEPLPEQTGLAADGENITAITSAQDKNSLRFLAYLPAAAPYEILKIDKALITEPKGGLSALMANQYGVKDIHKVEGNPLIAKIIRDDYMKFSGNIFESAIWTGYARSFLKTRGTFHYDLIDLTMTDASVSGFFGIAEDYRFTVEAFIQYLSALNKNGLLSVNLYLSPPPRKELRIPATVIAAYEKLGGKDPASRLAAIRSWDSMTILFKNSPFTEHEIEQLKIFSGDRRFDLVYYPGIKKAEANLYVKLPSDEYFSGFQNIINPETRTRFISSYLFDIDPVSDNNPFFHYHLKFSGISEIHKVMGQKWLYFLEEGYLLPVILIAVLVLSLIIILIPVFFRPLERFEQFKRSRPSALIYFAMLGAGYMFVEVSLIQKSILLFENPSYSVTVILTAILISSGGGSIMSSKFTKLSTPYSLLAVSLLIFICTFFLAHTSGLLLSLPLLLKATIIFIVLSPLGFFMGIPFPMGMKLLGENHKHLIPWAWAVNACLSVIAPVMTIMIALSAGLQAVLYIGALAYLAAFLAFIKMIKK